MAAEDQVTALAGTLETASASADRFGRALSTALKAAAVDGKALDQVLKTMVADLSSSALDAALRPLASLISGSAGSLVGEIGGAIGGLSAAQTGTAATSTAVPGAAAAAGAGGAVHVTFNVATPDAASFRRSEAQLGIMLARAVGRGRRGL